MIKENLSKTQARILIDYCFAYKKVFTAITIPKFKYKIIIEKVSKAQAEELNTIINYYD